MREASNSFELLDSHCHLDLYPSADPVIREAEAHKILTVAVTNAPFLFAHTRHLADKSEYVIAALGLHPELVVSHEGQLEQFFALLPQTRFIGEIGLDYVTNDESVRSRQRRVFEAIVEACDAAGDKILTIHSRRSSGDALAVIGKHFRGTTILHWYSGSLRDLRQALATGCYFSVNTSMVRSKSGRRIIEEIPLDRLLTETDGPFIKFGGKPATPFAVSSIVEELAGFLQLPPDEIAKTIRRNTLAAFAQDRA